MLTEPEILRYSRHLLLEEIGEPGQNKLKSSKVLIMGLGGLGSPAAVYLAAAGVGTLLLADFDTLDISNLQRQIAYQSKDVGASKVTLMKAHINELNPHIKVRTVNCKMDLPQLLMELQMVDLVLDCTDNMASRQMINDACVQAKKPLIVGAAIRFEGQLMFFDHQQAGSACYHCLFPNSEEQQLNCANSGVLGPVVGTIAMMQALEAIKYIVGLPSGIANKLKLFDGKMLDWQTFAINKDPLCSVCGEKNECDSK